MKILLINGFPLSGKTTFTNFCSNEGYVYNLSTVDIVKDIAKYCGWNGEKTPESRKFLSDLKDLLTEWNDIPIKNIKYNINNVLNSEWYRKNTSEETIFFIDVREPKELERLRNEWGAKTLLIQRPTIENNNYSNHADAEVMDFNYDFIIYNSGTLEDLKQKAKDFIILLSKQDWESRLED